MAYRFIQNFLKLYYLRKCLIFMGFLHGLVYQNSSPASTVHDCGEWLLIAVEKRNEIKFLQLLYKIHSRFMGSRYVFGVIIRSVSIRLPMWFIGKDRCNRIKVFV